MTVYNAGHHLAPAVQSILLQSFCDFEFLIVDDASTDGSIEVLKSFATNDARIRLILNGQNKGQTACLNQGLREARSRWIARQDADDISLPNRLAAQWSAIQACPDLVLLGVNGWIIDESNVRRGMIHTPLHDSGIRWAMPFRNPFIHTGVVFRADSGFYDEAFHICQDWEFWSRLAERGRMLNLKDRLVAYRHSEKSLSHASGQKTRSETEDIVARIWRCRHGCDPACPELLAEFRESLSPQSRSRFWEMYRGVRAMWKRGDIRQAVAMHHVQVAGAVMGKNQRAFLAEIVAAFGEAPVWTIQILAEGFLSRREFRT